MTPHRQKTVNGHTVTEYYWGGRMVAYLDSHADERSFDEIVGDLDAKAIFDAYRESRI